MFQKFEIHGVHANVDTKLRAYVTKKIGNLDRYISRHARPSAHADVHLKEEAKLKNNNHSRCEVTIHLPHETIVVKEDGLNMYAAVDITEAKLKQQLQKYKELHGSGKLQRHLFARFRRREA
ncbi:MAG TPA: ribosome-associated translation inhibitor RaiA [Candidatus Saccharimonadales bacterium]|jgi:ribosomal subunit interface protein|nr:ribosome-associated translation inhibitor RaiA [Candidatus Saccharimonadales bacterium]